MVEKARIFTCDRCKTTTVLKDSDTDAEGYEKNKPDDWYSLNGWPEWLLCDICKEQFFKFIRNEGDVHDKSEIHN